jgi:TonB-dependent starch-binding outer membrane protein SusC
MRKIACLLAVLFIVSANLFAQNRTVTGIVTDEKDGTPLAGVSVTVKGTSIGTTTNNEGFFSLSIPSNARALTFSFVNYETRDLSIGASARYSLTLTSKDRNLQEVVVVGYQTQRKKEVTGAIAKVSGKDIENLPMQSFDRAIQGRAAGVNVQSNNGVPGGAVQVRIRGIGSISAGNEPLYVVDGVQINNGLLTTNVTQSNPLAFLNPNDIESVEILKDASAAAIYGARAANGVVLVTTKKGKAGRTNFQVNAYTGYSDPLKFIPVLNNAEFFQARYEGYLYQRITNPNNTPAQARTLALADMNLPSGTTDKQLQDLPNYDWQRDAAFRKGTVYNVDFSMSGGNEKTNFYLSASYNKQQAIIFPVDFSRGTFASTIKHKVTNKLTVENQLNLSTIYQKGPYSGGGGVTTAFGSPSYSASLMLPINPFKNPDGTFYGLPGSGQIFAGVFNQNLLATAEYDSRWQRTNQLVGNFKVSYDLAKGLKYTGLFGLDYRQIQNQYYGDPRNSDWFNRRGYAFAESQWNTNFITSHTFNYINSFGKHNINAVAGSEYRADVNEALSAEADGFPSSEFRYINSASNPLSVGGFWTGSKTFSLFGKVNYDFDKRYLFSATLRRDGSSRFGEDNFFAVFPSFSAGWNIVNEKFMESVKFISDLKLRVSYGQNGNDQIGNFSSRGLYGSGRVYGGSGGINPTQLANPDLRWEIREEWNAGIDFGLFQNRISAVVDVYRRVNKDLLLSRPLYQTTGFGSVTQNLGSVENKGLEIGLRTVNIDGRSFKWVTSFNISFQKNKVLSLYDGLQFLPSDPSIRVGQSLGSIFTQKYAGVNPATGRPMWYDINGNITYQPNANDRVIIGNTLPKQYGGLNNTITYKNFELDVFFQYDYGRLTFDGQYLRLLEIGSRISNAIKPDYDRRWQKPGDITDVPRPINGAAEPRGAAFTSGDRTFMRADYIRLKNLTLTYNVAKTLTSRLGVSSARFYVQGVNLWTYADWPGYDPEFLCDSMGLVPQSRNFTVGLTVGF